MKNIKWDNAHNLINKFEQNVIRKAFPHAVIGNALLFGSPDVSPNSFEGKISSENLFKDTQYEYKGDGNLLHFTSLFGVKSILESGFFRLSEFGNLLDTNELIYASQVFQGNDLFARQIQSLSDLKNNVFCLSACKADESTIKNSFMWDNYSDKGKGVSIEFSLTNKNPYGYVIGNLMYGESSLELLRNLKTLAEKFKNENDFFPNNFIELFLEIQSFHKSRMFEMEKEVRILFRNDKNKYEDHNHSMIYKDISSNQEVKYFSKIYIKGHHPLANINSDIDEMDLFRYYPQIEVKKITFGFNISPEKLTQLQHFFFDLKKKNNYDFELWRINKEMETIKMG